MKKGLVLLALVLVFCSAGCETAATKSRPLIGITSVYNTPDSNNPLAWTSVDFTYVSAITDNGGTPVILPTVAAAEVIEQYAAELDGLVLIGGYDIPPQAYGEKPHETVAVMQPQRYQFESSLIPLWLETGKPVLGVCLGLQFTNVLSGGSLIQDIPSQVGTKVVHRGKDVYHWVNIEPDSQLAKILGKKRVLVYSNHHQAVKRLGKGLKVTARSDDDVIEALERTTGGFGLFVQWHPESMTDDTAHRDAVYGTFIKMCKKK